MDHFNFIIVIKNLYQAFGMEVFIVFIVFMCFLSLIYFVLIGPILFKFWIKPRIEQRYGVKLNFDSPLYVLPFSSWGTPPIEMSLYILVMLFGYSKLIKNPNSFLSKIQYKVCSASKLEIVVSIITAFFLVCFVCAAGFAIFNK